MAFQLRDYQQSLVDRCFESLDQGETPLLVAPTGAGKTVIAAEIVRHLVADGQKVLVTAHRIEIIHQLAAAIEAHAGIKPGLLIAGSTVRFETEKVVVAMVPTAVRRLDSLPLHWALLEDEAHHSIAKTWGKLRDALMPGKRAGLTATPITPSGGGLGPAGFTVLHEGPSLHWLIENQHLSSFRYFAAPPSKAINTKGVKVVRGDYDQKELSSSINGLKLAADAVDLYRKHCSPGVRTIAACLSLEHAELVNAQFNDAGIPSGFIHGGLPVAQREELLNAFRAGRITVLASVAVIDEGFDLPLASALLLLRPTRSLRLYRQLVGRVLRSAPGKKEALIIDAGQAYADCGLPDAPANWTLEGLKPSPPRPTITDEEGEVTEHPQAELILEQQLKLEQITREQAERGRLQRGRENFATLCSMIRNGKIPKGAVYTALPKQPRSRGEFTMAAHTFSRSREWGVEQWEKQNAALLEKGLEPTPIQWPDPEADALSEDSPLEEVWSAATNRCQQPGNRRLLQQHFRLSSIQGSSATVMVGSRWGTWARRHHRDIESVLAGAAGRHLEVEFVCRF